MKTVFINTDRHQKIYIVSPAVFPIEDFQDS